MSVQALQPTPAAAAPPRSGTAAPQLPAAPALAALEPSLVNRLLGVAVAVYTVPVLLELRRLAAGDGGTTASQQAWLLATSAALATGFALVLRGAPGLSSLRAGRALCACLAFQAALFGGSLLAHLAR
jgi:hypothetical protein